MQFYLSLKLPEDLAYVTLVRRVSREMLGSFGVNRQDLEDLEVLIGELATNAVCHAHDQSYDVEIKLEADRAIVTVSDRGAGFVRETVPPPGTVRPNELDGSERIGGWGLPLVEMLADTVEFRPNQPHGTVVRAEKRLQKLAEKNPIPEKVA